MLENSAVGLILFILNGDNSGSVSSNNKDSSSKTSVTGSMTSDHGSSDGDVSSLESGSSQSSTTSKIEGTNSNVQAVDPNADAAIVTYISWDYENFCDMYIIHYSGETILSIENVYGTTAERYNQGEPFDSETMESWVDRFESIFDDYNFNTNYIETNVYAREDEIGASIKAINLNDTASQQYLESQELFWFYESGMTFSEFTSALTEDGYEMQ